MYYHTIDFKRKTRALWTFFVHKTHTKHVGQSTRSGLPWPSSPDCPPEGTPDATIPVREEAGRNEDGGHPLMRQGRCGAESEGDQVKPIVSCPWGAE